MTIKSTLAHIRQLLSVLSIGVALTRWLPLLVFISGMSITLLFWTHEKNNLAASQQADFDLASRLTVNSIKQRMMGNEQVLRGVQGLFAASDSVSRAEFHDYVTSLRIDETHPGMQGIGFIRLNRAEARPAVTILYHEPLVRGEKGGFGFDMSADPVLRGAMDRARDNDAVAISGKVNLGVDSGRIQSGCIVYLPVYTHGFQHDSPASRRLQIAGWVYAPLRLSDLISPLLAENNADMHVALSDSNEKAADALLFDSGASGDNDSSKAQFKKTEHLVFGGRTWEVSFSSRAALEKRYSIVSPLLMAFTGTLSSLLLALLIWQLVNGRRRAVQQTDEIRAELKASELRLLSVFEQIPNIAVQGYDRDRRVIFWNSASEKLYGFTKEEAMGQRIEDLFIPDNMVSMVVSAIAGWVDSGVPIPAAEYVVQRKDGTQIHVFSSKVMQHNLKHEPEIFSIDVELTELKWAERELLDLAGQLSEEIAERKLVQQELCVKQIQLEKINETLSERIKLKVEELRQNDQILISQNRQAAMGEMISNIAHQWRQPLNTIGLIMQYLQRTCSSQKMSAEELRQEFSNALSIVMHMSKTIDDFRNFFSPSKSKQSFYIAKAINQALSFSSADMNRHHIKVLLDTDEEMSTVGYPNEYAQVLLNILNNARDKLIEAGVGEPCIHICVFAENGLSVTTVHDNGGGIPEDVIDRVFDPYFSTKIQGKGTGIGLYMSKVIIEKHMGGSLTARNKDGGAEFRIEV